MRRLSFVSIAAVLMILFGAIAAQAQQGKGKARDDDDKQGWGMRGQFSDPLDMTADQIKQVRTMRVDFQKKMIPLRSDVQLAQIELQEMIRSGAGQATVDAKIDELGAIRTQMQKLRVQQRLQFRDVLTKEQKDKLDAMPMGGWGFGKGDGPRGMGGHGMRGPGRGMGMTGPDCPMMGDDDPGFAPGPHFGDCPWIGDDDDDAGN